MMSSSGCSRAPMPVTIVSYRSGVSCSWNSSTIAHDGLAPSCAIVDEFHEHDTPDLYETMVTGMGAREQPLLLIITTAGVNLAGPCDQRMEYARDGLEGKSVE